MSMVMVWTIRDRAITKLEFFLDRARAFDSVGLSEQAVTRGNVEVVLRQYADTNARDFAAAMDAYAEDVTLISHWGAGLLSPTATGKAAVGEWFGDWFSQFGSDYRFDIEDARGAGNRVFLLASHHGHGRGSGAPIEHRLAYAYTVRLGKVQHVELWTADHAGRRAARAAVGLSE